MGESKLLTACAVFAVVVVLFDLEPSYDVGGFTSLSYKLLNDGPSN